MEETMSWTTIDRELCTQCGICMTRCLMNYKEVDGVITSSASMETCNLCGHCVALCPTDAITHHKMDMGNFVDLDKGVGYDFDGFKSFVRGRRSHRIFEDRQVPREHLGKLVDICRYAPTGSNRQTVEITVLQDRDKIQRLSDHTVDFFENRIDELEKEAREYEAAGKDLPQTTRSALTMVETLKRVVMARKFGMEVIFHRAPAVMLFHSPTETSTPKDDCVIASTTVALAARTLSLETTYIGLFEFVANRYPPIVRELDLPAGHRVFSILVLGYPKLKFLRTVDRKPMKARWL
jgi:nitroreductase/NAD-dependent dihydropyrimidine dehydrogenase PreA subunit